MTSALRTTRPERLPVTERPPSLSVEMTFGFEAWSAGNTLKSTDATSAVTEITISSRPSMSMSPQPGTNGRMRAGIVLLRIEIDTPANASDAGTAMAASTALSISSCRSSRARPAPIASRNAISRRRSHPRASSRLAMLAPPMSEHEQRTDLNHPENLIHAGVDHAARERLHHRREQLVLDRMFRPQAIADHFHLGARRRRATCPAPDGR